MIPAGFAPGLGSSARPEAGPGGRAAGAELPGAGPGVALGTIRGGLPRKGLLPEGLARDARFAGPLWSFLC